MVGPLSENVYFRAAAFLLCIGGADVLNEDAVRLVRITNVRIQIYGHCDEGDHSLIAS
jgi:hypothetical protein